MTLFIGEIGISRVTPGAKDYLETAFKACEDENIGVFVYAFRDDRWDIMDYEYGVNNSMLMKGRNANNPLALAIKRAVKKVQVIK